MLWLLIESATRACVLAAIVWLVLKALRVRDARTQITAWTMVLIASLSMPLLMQWTRVKLRLPLFQLPTFYSAATTYFGESLNGASSLTTNPAPAFGSIALAIYIAITSVLLLRLLFGIGLTNLMRRAAQPLASIDLSKSAKSHASATSSSKADRLDHTGCDVRVSTAIRSPVTFATTILVPTAFVEWPALKQRAVILHEQSHVEQGDFYLQLLANVCRAIFWFNPVIWWLQHRLASLAEFIGDAAAVGDHGDRKHYASTLLEIAHHTRPVHCAVAMARPVTVKERVSKILDGRVESSQKNGRNRLLLSMAMIPLIAIVAGCVVVPILHLEGKWIASMPPEGRCQFPAVLTLQVKGSVIKGEITNPEGVFPVFGDLDEMGRGNLKMGKFWGVIEFKGDHFKTDYTNGCGGRHAIGQRT